MSIHKLHEAVALFHRRAIEDPSEEARCIYQIVLNVLGGIDEFNLDDLQAATAKALTPGGRVRPLAMTPEEEKFYELEAGHMTDTERNPEMELEA